MGKGKGRGRGRGRGVTKLNAENGQPGMANQNGHTNVPRSENIYAENANDDYPTLGSPGKVGVESSAKSEPVESSPPKQQEGPVVDVKTAEIPVEPPTEKLENLTISPTPKEAAKENGTTANNKQPAMTNINGKHVATTTTVIGTSITSEQMRKKYPLPKRPGFGKAGQRIALRANFFPIKIPDADIHHYDVTIHDGKNTDKCPKSLNRKIIEEMVDTYKKVFVDRPVYDGTKNIYTKAPLCFSGVQDFTLDIDEEGKKRSFKISMKWVSQVNLLALQNMIKGKPGVVVPQNAIQALDLVLRHAATLQYIPIGSKLFTPNGAVNIGLGLDVWHGYHQSVRPTQWKMMLNIDVCATAFYRTLEVIEFLYEITRYDCTKQTKPLSDLARKQFSKELRGLKIEITYAGNQRRKYRVNGLTRDSAQNQTFSLEKDGKKSNITVRNYFKDEKGIQLKFPWLPCLHVGKSDKNVYIPMEGCRIIPGQRCVKKLTEDQTANMIKNTAKKPEERRETVMKIMQESRFNKDPYVKGFGVEVDPNMMELDGRVLSTPGILYDGGGQPLIPSKGAWNMKGIKLYKGATINSWGLVVYNDAKKPGLREDQCIKFQNELMRTANGMGIRIGQPCYQRVITDQRDNASKIVTEAVSKDNKIELLVVVLPGKTPFYADLKRICETENGYTDIEDENVKQVVKGQGLSTQCIQAKNAQKCNPMTLAQLCLKINAKMGGLNNAIDTSNTFTRPARIFAEPVIFLGADVTHPGIGDKSSPSIAAVVGSVDPYPIRYAVCVRVQSHRAEMIEDLTDITKDLLKQFYRAVGKKPARIIMFRDGVSEGQFQQVLYHEMTAIQKACSQLGKDYTPAITFIVVQKRHHARFTVQNLRDADRSGNCPPGTTIDTTVCHPTEFDYYQYSHAGIQGTSRPTHYHVLWDDSDFKADELQSLSFMLCHLYVRCTRSVSIPAPAYYAHHVAFRARYHLQKEEGSTSSDSGKDDLADKLERNNLKEIVKPHPKLSSRMYFV